MHRRALADRCNRIQYFNKAIRIAAVKGKSLKVNEPIWALGTMSGTSLDGVDAALLLTDGEQIIEFGDSVYRPYSADEKAVLRSALGAWPGQAGVSEATEIVEIAHVEAIQALPGAQIAGFHGQTLAHDPQAGRTHQAGNGKVLADALNLPVIWDFRSTDMRLGGQGAPLAPFFHFACARYLKLDGAVAFLNLGGVGNITYVDADQPRPEDPDAVLAFDTGPANAPINDVMAQRAGAELDHNGETAARGAVHEPVVSRFLEDGYFLKLPPKSLDRDAFSSLVTSVAELSLEDAAATLTACAAASVARALEHLPRKVSNLLLCGGGRRNPVLCAMIAQRCGVPVQDVDQLGLNGDMLEAQAFAHLAVRVARGLPTSCPSTTGVAAAVGGGEISRP